MRFSKKRLKKMYEVNYDLFGGDNLSAVISSLPEIDDPVENQSPSDLPTIDDLYKLFDKLNFRIFNNQLPRLRIKYSDKMLIAGSFMPSLNEIRIGRKYHRIFPDDIEDTLAHEMIHFIYPNHGPQFKRVAGKFGISMKAKDHPDLRTTYRYLYYCPSCGKEYPRRKRLRMASCGSCTSGRIFDRNFKLVLKKKR